ncbi:hypothetical protein ACFV6Z_06390 [Streptomyces sp. NPDC059818]|uniref:hypothetical protein n=1 Tax=Streptomyces sp. NPDC059818 TaxID=3346962 RepID=UPI00365B75C9
MPRARATLAVLAGVLCAAQFAEGTAWADAPDGGMETRHGPSLITIDNSNADSWLEIDRTLNVLGPLSRGTAGSDHDGGGGAIEQHVTGPSDARLQAAPVEQGEHDDTDGQEAGAAAGGDDPEGDADRDATSGTGQNAGTGTGGTGPQGAGPCASRPATPGEGHPACP